MHLDYMNEEVKPGASQLVWSSRRETQFVEENIPVSRLSSECLTSATEQAFTFTLFLEQKTQSFLLLRVDKLLLPGLGPRLQCHGK